MQGFLSIASKLGISAETHDVAIAALEHHLNLDGTGYPRVRVGRPKNLLSRIISIVDRYDAMTTDRIYRAALPPQKALAITRWGPRHTVDLTAEGHGHAPLGVAETVDPKAYGIEMMDYIV